MDAAQLWISQQLRRVESSAQQNIVTAMRAKTLAELVRLHQVHVPPEIRFARSTIPGLRRLEQTLNDKIGDLLKQRLEIIRKTDSCKEARELRGGLMLECECLRGHFATHYRRALDESARLVYLKEKEGQLR